MTDYTIDGVEVTPGLPVLDYNLDAGTVGPVQYTSHGVDWYRIDRVRGGYSTMDAGRLWTRVETNSGWLVAADLVTRSASGVKYDRITGREADVYTPPEDLVDEAHRFDYIRAGVDDEHSHGGTPTLEDGCR